jgi:hypothetical protein
MNKPVLLAFLAFISLLFPAQTAAAKGRAPERAYMSYSLRSENVNDTFTIDVSLPGSYNDGKAKAYPVLYLTDGNWRREQHGKIHEMAKTDGVKELIVVGIGYPDGYDLNSIRYRDLSFSADKFLAFIVKELIPWVDTRYRTLKGERTLWGSSFGGYFCVYALCNAADVTKGIFSTYIAASPSGNGFTMSGTVVLYAQDSEALLAKKTKELNVNLYIAVGGNETSELIAAYRSIVYSLHQSAFKGFTMKSETIPGKDHDTVWEPALHEGIKAFLKR